MNLRNGKSTAPTRSETPDRAQSKRDRRRLLQATTPPTSPVPSDGNVALPSAPTSDPTTPQSSAMTTPKPHLITPPKSPSPTPTTIPTTPTRVPSSPTPPPNPYSPTPTPATPPPTTPVEPEPPLPRPTRWRCPTCGTKYPLSATRRCLFLTCTTLVFASMHTTKRQGLPAYDRNRPRRRLEFPVRPDFPPSKGRARKKRTTDCRVDFDFAGWEARSAWRRRREDARLAAEAEERHGKKRKRSCEEDTEQEEETTRGAKPKREDEEEDRGPTDEETIRAVKRSKADEVLDRKKSEKEAKKAAQRRKEVAFVEGRFHCERDCDYPTHCRNSVFHAYKKGRAVHDESGYGFVYVGARVL